LARLLGVTYLKHEWHLTQGKPSMARLQATQKVRSRGRPQGSSRNTPFDRREELAAVALDLFAERNFAAVTIKDIASALGVNTALIYYYFDSKEDLFRAAIESALCADPQIREDQPRLQGIENEHSRRRPAGAAVL
jgi:DNA-binding transcriptional regulator YbjK